MDWLHRFAITVSCVTSLPFARVDEEQSVAGLSKYLPTVGLLIGALLLVSSHTLSTLAVSHPVSSVLIVILWLILSGGIHFDGLMDTADGIFSHRSPDRMLEIMRDSRVGNFGVMTGVAVILLKIAGLLSLSGSIVACALLLIPCWARWCETFAIGAFPYAREEGMGKIWHDTTRYPSDLALAAIIPIVATVLCAINFNPLIAATICGATVVSGLISAFYLSSIIKGHTGDTYGAVVELAEAGSLLLLILFGSRI